MLVKATITQVLIADRTDAHQSGLLTFANKLAPVWRDRWQYFAEWIDVNNHTINCLVTMSICRPLFMAIKTKELFQVIGVRPCDITGAIGIFPGYLYRCLPAFVVAHFSTPRRSSSMPEKVWMHANSISFSSCLSSTHWMICFLSCSDRWRMIRTCSVFVTT